MLGPPCIIALHFGHHSSTDAGERTLPLVNGRCNTFFTPCGYGARQDRVLNMPDDMWEKERQRKDNAAIDGRADNMAK